jgi:NAD(P)-dependent dehydrogenase (short-subunit alcohol dehydrogenase family)
VDPPGSLLLPELGLGTGQLASLATTDVDAARRFFTLRYWGAYCVAKYGSSSIRKGGSIVFTSGIAGQRPQVGWSLGASICAAMEGLTRALAVELAPIRVNIVSPGVVREQGHPRLHRLQRR